MTFTDYVSAWGRRRSSGPRDTPPEPRAFSNNDYGRLSGTIEGLAYSQLGHLYDDYTADEMRQLFCPEGFRQSLTQTYSLETERSATGLIYVDLKRVIGTMPSLLEGPKCEVSPDKLVLRVQFNRSNTPDGFVTPEPVFGTQFGAVDGLRGMPPGPLHDRFVDTMRLMVQVAGEWSVVNWVFRRLHETLRTPQQVRYVWPAIYTLASKARLQLAESLAEPSARAGNNASAPVDVLPYLKPTYEVVSRSVLLNDDDNASAMHYRNGQMRLVTNSFFVRTPEGDTNITGI